jgi:serine protease Do
MQVIDKTLRTAARGVTQKMSVALVALGLGVSTGVMTGFVPFAAPPAMAETAPEVAPLETAMDAVLVVRTNDAEDKFLGSAFLWGDQAVVAVTNAHVVGDAEEVRLIDRHGNEEIGYVIARDAVRDVAVISVEPGRRGLTAAPDPAALGLEVYALGAPLGIEFTLTEGLVSAPARQVETAVPMLMLQHDAAVNPGSSGGPLVDAQGRLLGMNSQIADGSRMFVGIAYAITAADLDRIVTGLIEETLPPFPTLGLTARPVDRKAAEALGIPMEGLLIDGTQPGSLAEISGLKGGDVILAVDGTALLDPGEFAFLIEAAVPAGTADLTIRRDGAEITVPLVLVKPEAEETGIGIKTRDISEAGIEGARIKSYRLGALGVVLGDEGTVTGVTENSPALFAGLSKGDRILSVNGQEMDAAALDALELTGPALILVQSPGGATRHIYLDPWGKHDGARAIGGANVLDPAVVVF